MVQLPEIIWVTPITMFNRRDSSFIAYGNEACVSYLYGDVCLMVKVGSPGSRTEMNALSETMNMSPTVFLVIVLYRI